MGRALLSGWLSGDESFTIVDPRLDRATDTIPGEVALVSDREKIAGQRFDVIVAAIKPQMIDTVLPNYSGMFTPGGYLLSIAAGCSIERLRAAMNGIPVIRVMPNMPAAIGKGVSGICASKNVGGEQLDHARSMMERVGTAMVVGNEDELDRLTAIAGSGPGYVFEIARSFAQAATGLGFSEEEGIAMVLNTMRGAIEMAQQSPLSLEELRNSVTSKNGTTEAGLNSLNGSNDLDQLFTNTLKSAYERAVSLR